MIATLVTDGLGEDASWRRSFRTALVLTLGILTASEGASAQQPLEASGCGTRPAAERPISQSWASVTAGACCAQGAGDDALHFAQPIPAPATRPAVGGHGLSWDVSERIRYSSLTNQFRPGLSGNDQATVFRTLAKAEYAWRHVAVGGEIQDVRAYLTDSQSNVSTLLVNPFDLLQAYVTIGPAATSRTPRPQVQVGRFTMELGSGRIVAQEAYRDVTRSFTGAKARLWPSTKGALTLLAVLPTRTLPEGRQDLLHNKLQRDRDSFHQVFSGAFYERERLPKGMRAEGYAFALAEHDDPGRLETRDRSLWTAGFRLLRAPARATWDLELEGAWQWGEARATTDPADTRDLDVTARLLHAQGSYTLARAWSPRLGLEYDYGSGDSSPTDGRWNRFDGLFGNRRVDVGPSGIYTALGRENIETLGVRLSLAPNARTDGFAVYRVVRLAAAADAFASTGVRDRTGRSGKDGGQQVDVRARVWLEPGLLRLETGATYLIAGSFLKHAPNATREGNTTHFYVDLTYTIGSKRASAGTRRGR